MSDPARYGYSALVILLAIAVAGFVGFVLFGIPALLIFSVLSAK